jgi:hypothetical protein
MSSGHQDLASNLVANFPKCRKLRSCRQVYRQVHSRALAFAALAQAVHSLQWQHITTVPLAVFFAFFSMFFFSPFSSKNIFF